MHLARCADCGILFLTDSRNIGHKNLRCPFGCRASHARKTSKARSTAYYQTNSGKLKKRKLNENRAYRKDGRQEVEGVAKEAPCRPGTPHTPVSDAAERLPGSTVPQTGTGIQVEALPAPVSGASAPFVPTPLPDHVECPEGPASTTALPSLDLLQYLSVALSWIERRPVEIEEVLSAFSRIVRQRHIARRKRMDYVIAQLNAKPP